MSTHKKTSLKDISKVLKVSPTTISLIINNKADHKISERVIKEVKEYIKKIGYKPNMNARFLRTGKTKSVVFMVEDISDPFFSAVAREIERIMTKKGYNLILCSTENDRDHTKELITFFQERQVDAFIITPPEKFESDFKELTLQGFRKVILFDRYYENINHDYVVLDNIKDSQSAVRLLYDTGYRRIAYIGSNSDLSVMVERYQGYKEAAKSLSLFPKALLLTHKIKRNLEGQKKIKTFLEDNNDIDSILFASNSVAVNGLKVLKDMDLTIPNDIGIVSFDDRDVFQLYTPSISVVDQPIKNFARELTKGVLKILAIDEDVKAPQLQVKLNGKIVKRNSI